MSLTSSCFKSNFYILLRMEGITPFNYVWAITCVMLLLSGLLKQIQFSAGFCMLSSELKLWSEMFSNIACTILWPDILIKDVGELGECLSDPPKCFEVPPPPVCPSPFFSNMAVKKVSDTAHWPKILLLSTAQEKVWTVSSLCFGLCVTLGDAE